MSNIIDTAGGVCLKLKTKEARMEIVTLTYRYDVPITVECIPIPTDECYRPKFAPWIRFVVRKGTEIFDCVDFGELDKPMRRRRARFFVEDACRTIEVEEAKTAALGNLPPIPWRKLIP
jgi:hypothetical protein